MHNNKGYYLGRMVFDQQLNAWQPFSRESDYFETGDLADQHLFRVFSDVDFELHEENGKYTLYLVWVHPDLQVTELKDVIATYDDRSTAYLYYQADAALYFHECGYNKYYDPQELFLK